LDELSEINESLKSAITDQAARIRIAIETGYDEAGMVATRSGYLRLAQFLVEFVLKAEAQQTETWQVYGLALPGSSAIGYLFGPVDEVKIDSLMLAATEREVNETADAFLRDSPPPSKPADEAP